MAYLDHVSSMVEAVEVTRRQVCCPGLPKTLPTNVAGRNMEFSYYRLHSFGAAAHVRNTEYGGVRNSVGVFQCRLMEVQSGLASEAHIHISLIMNLTGFSFLLHPFYFSYAHVHTKKMVKSLRL